MSVAAVGESVDRDALQARIRQVCAVMRSHAGAIELVDVTPDGVVEVRFLGMCQGCQFRPLTMHATIIPALLAVPGVTEVSGAGARISEYAAQRLQAAIGDQGLRLAPLRGTDA